MKPEAKIELLLPWLHNGSLQGDEKVLAYEIEEGLQQAGLAERQFDDALQKHLKQQPIESPGQLGWYRLQRELTKLAVEKPTTEKAEVKKIPGWFKPTMAAAVLIIVIQGGVIMNTLQQSVVYTPMGTQQEHSVVIQIEFQAEATEERIRNLLSLVDGRFIDGPGAVGIYRVSLNLTGKDQRAIDNRIKVLRSHTSIVRFVSYEQK